MMRRLTEGRSAALLPDLLGALFALCGHAHRLTARRAVGAALGLQETPAQAQRAARLARCATVRDHLQRLAFDLPARIPVAGLGVDPAWLRGAPLPLPLALDTDATAGCQDDALQSSLQQLPRWLERALLGMPTRDWLEAWEADGPHWVARWARHHAHPVARWLDAVRSRAQALTWPCRPLALLDAQPLQLHAAMHELAHSLREDAGFTQRPCWHRQPAETGPWTRAPAAAGRSEDTERTVWMRLVARLPDLLRVSTDEQALRQGALALGAGAAIAWTEMARGLLVHWVQLEPGARAPAMARIAACRVLAPTEWNFHPDGGLAHALRGLHVSAADAPLAAAALDPCIDIVVETAPEVSHA